MVVVDLRSSGGSIDPTLALQPGEGRTFFPGHTLRPTELPPDEYHTQPPSPPGEEDDNSNNNNNKDKKHIDDGVWDPPVDIASGNKQGRSHHPFRDARLQEERRPEGLNPDLTEWPYEDELLDRPIYNFSTSAVEKERRFISHLEFKGKCWYEVTNFCIVRGDLVLYHDPATDKGTKKDSLRMCNEFSQRSATIRLKYRSEPMPERLPGPLLENTPGWVLQFWCQDLFHSTLALMPAYQTRMRYFNNNNNPDIYLRIARGIRKKGQFCHIKFGHPLSYNESHNKRWGGDKQFPFAGNPYWKMYKALSPDHPWRVHPLYGGSGGTKKTACYRTGVIDKLWVKQVTRTMARKYSDAQLQNLEVPTPLAPRQCGKYRVTVLDRRGKTRRLTNIDNILEIARNKVPGFSVVRSAVFEHLSLTDQIALIANTDVLLGMHGNGLTWQQFMQPGSCLIELCHTWYMPYALLFGHSYFHSSIKNNPTYKRDGEYVPFAHNETEIEALLVKAKAALDKTSCGAVEQRATLDPNEQLDYMFKGCAPHC